MIPTQFVGGHAPAQSNFASSETCYNLYAEKGAELNMLVSRPSLSAFNVRYTAAITSITRAGATATVTTTANHYLRTGESVLIAGATQTEYNGTFTITRTASNTFTYTVSGTPATPATGTITWTDVNRVRAVYSMESGVGASSAAINFAVVGSRLYTVDSAGVMTIGPTTAATYHFTNYTGPLSITDNGFGNGQQVVFVEVGVSNGTWVWDYNGGVPTFAALFGVTKANSCCFINGYIIVDDQNNTGRFYYSNLYDAATMNALNFATAEGGTDMLQAVFADRRELYLFGSRTVEVWMNSGGADNPFQKFEGGFMQAGLSNPGTVARHNNSIVWLGENERGEVGVMRLGDGYSAQIISPPWLNEELMTNAWSLRDPNYHWAYSFEWRGHEFYVLTLTTSGATAGTGATYVYDAASELWFRWSQADNLGNIWLTTGHAYISPFNYTALPIHLMSGSTDGRIWRLAAGSADFGTAITRQRTFDLPQSATNRERTRVFRLELLGENDNTSRTVSLSWSRDGGRTFGTPVSVTCSCDGTTKYIWSKLGAAFDWTFKLTSTDTAGVTQWEGAWVNVGQSHDGRSAA